MQVDAAGMRAVVVAIVASVVLIGGHASSSSSKLATSAFPAAYSQNVKGLELQFQPLLQGFATGQTSAEIDQALAIFSLQNSNDWFEKYFAKEHVEQLNGEYKKAFESFRRDILDSLRRSPAGTSFRVHCKAPHPDPSARIQPRQDAAVPLVAVQIEQFVTEFEPEHHSNGARFSLFANYAYVDGAYRYVGKGAYPFWSVPDTARKP
ncbi:MAG TPA: hypothetical protein VK795_06080 [Terriglobales bacterium]|nr:hypothetical protein [Terriglobales bacterium]